MAVFYQNSGSISDLVVSNKLDATGSLFGTASYVQSASSAEQMSINVSNNGYDSGFISIPATSYNVSQLVFSNADSFSFGLNGSTLTATATIGGGGDTFTYPYYNPKNAYVQALGTWGNGSLFMQPFQSPNIQLDRVAIPVYISATTQNNSTMGLSFSMSWGLYTRNNSTLSLLSDYTVSTTFQSNFGQNSTSIYNGIRLWTMGLTQTLTEGQYYAGMISSVTNTRGTISNIVASQQNSSFLGIFGQPYSLTAQYTRGLGFYSTTTNALPSSVAISELYGAATYSTAAGSATNVLRAPIFYLVSQTF